MPQSTATAPSPAATLPAELVAHVLRFSLEASPLADWTALEERRDLFLFGNVCRAWYLAAVGWTRFAVRSAKEARGLAIKVARAEREQNKAASGRTTRATSAWPTSHARELVLCQPSGGDNATSRAYATLVRACTRLESLEVEPGDPWKAGDVDLLLGQLEGAARANGAASLRRLEVIGFFLHTSTLIK